MRARFDAAKDEKDPRKSQLILADGCKELWQKKHFKPFRCKNFTFNFFGSQNFCSFRERLLF